jgi:internalin A
MIHLRRRFDQLFDTKRRSTWFYTAAFFVALGVCGPGGWSFVCRYRLVLAVERVGGRVLVDSRVSVPRQPMLGRRFALACQDIIGADFSDSGLNDSDLATIPQVKVLRAIDFSNCPITDEGIRSIGASDSIRKIRLDGTDVTGFGLRFLNGISNLEEIHLSTWSSADGVATVELLGMPNVRLLNCYRADVSAIKFSRLSAPEAVRHLSLGRTYIEDAGLADLCLLVGLEELNINYTAITDVTVERIARLTQLKRCWLNCWRVTDRGLEHIRKCHALEHLALENSGVTDAGMTHISNLKRLRELSLIGTRISDRGLRELSRTTSLESVAVNGTDVTADGISELKRAIPGIIVHR